MLSRHHRIALVDDAADAVLVVMGETGRGLPRHEERWPSLAELRTVIDDTRATLIAPPWREPDGTVVHVFVASAPHPGEWLPLDELEHLDASPHTRARLPATVREWREGIAVDRAEWFVRGWYERVGDWVAEELATSGATIVGDPVAVKVWSLSAVLRFRARATDGSERNVWFKATCDGFHDEAAVTRVIVAIAPEIAPRLLAVDAGRAWMLLEEIVEDDGAVDLGVACAVAAEMARVQLATLADLDRLRAAGAPDRGLEATIEGLHALIADSVEAQVMSPAQRARAVEIEPWLAQQVGELYALGLPDAVNHGDLHLGNIGFDGARPVLFDWTDACVTHPYLDARHLAENAARDLDGPQDAATVRRAVQEAFCGPWAVAFPDVDHAHAWELTAVVETVFTAISYEQIIRAQPAVSRWELGGMVADLLDRLSRLHEAGTGEGMPRLEP